MRARRHPVGIRVDEILSTEPTLRPALLYEKILLEFPNATKCSVYEFGLSFRKRAGIRLPKGGPQHGGRRAFLIPVWQALIPLLVEQPALSVQGAYDHLRKQFPGVEFKPIHIRSQVARWRKANGVAQVASGRKQQLSRLAQKWEDPTSLLHKIWVVIEPILTKNPRTVSGKIGRILTEQFPSISDAQRNALHWRVRAWRQANGIRKSDLVVRRPLTEEQQWLVKENADLVGAMIARTNWRIPGLTEEDLRQEGFFAMIGAAPLFNPAFGKASTFFCNAINDRFCRLLQIFKRQPKLVQQKINKEGQPINEPSHETRTDQGIERSDLARLLVETAENVCGADRGRTLATELLKGQGFQGVTACVF